jgi:hypothetical protein
VPPSAAIFARHEGEIMGESLIALVAVVMTMGIPLAVLYTFYRVRKLRTDERLAAMARGVNVPMEPELTQVQRSRRYGVLLSAAALGYMAVFALLARFEPDAWPAVIFGLFPLALGLGFFVDAYLVRRDMHTA